MVFHEIKSASLKSVPSHEVGLDAGSQISMGDAGRRTLVGRSSWFGSSSRRTDIHD